MIDFWGQIVSPRPRRRHTQGEAFRYPRADGAKAVTRQRVGESIRLLKASWLPGGIALDLGSSVNLC